MGPDDNGVSAFSDITKRYPLGLGEGYTTNFYTPNNPYQLHYFAAVTCTGTRDARILCQEDQ